MEYFTLQGSCLISILIPLNLAIGDYTLWFKKNNAIRYKRITDVVLLLIGGLLSIYLIKKRVDPYIPFIFFAGILVAIIQNSFFLKSRNVNADNILIDFIGIIFGGIIISLPHINIFYEMFLSNTYKEAVILCLTIYSMWGTEKIIFHCIDLFRSLKGVNID